MIRRGLPNRIAPLDCQAPPGKAPAPLRWRSSFPDQTGYRQRRIIVSLRELFLSSARSALALTCCLGLPNALAEEAAHGEHEGEHAHHYHHEVAPGFTRTLAAYAVPAVTLIDQSGQRVSLPELLATDRPVLLNFIYTSCTVICPVMSATFEKVQSGLGEEARRVLMVSISIDPEQDTPEALAAYAKRFHAGPQWSFLTGSLEEQHRRAEGIRRLPRRQDEPHPAHPPARQSQGPMGALRWLRQRRRPSPGDPRHAHPLRREVPSRDPSPTKPHHPAEPLLRHPASRV